ALPRREEERAARPARHLEPERPVLEKACVRVGQQHRGGGAARGRRGAHSRCSIDSTLWRHWSESTTEACRGRQTMAYRGRRPAHVDPVRGCHETLPPKRTAPAARAFGLR